jgi:hypothetical protein
MPALIGLFLMSGSYLTGLKRQDYASMPRARAVAPVSVV